MADQFDQAQEIDALMRSSAMAQQAKKAAAMPKLEPTGECQNPACGEPLRRVRNPAGELAMPLFCNADCAKQHARCSK